MFLFLAGGAGQALLNDADTGYHIRAGDYMLTAHAIPEHDIFSQHEPPLPWTTHEWLSEIAMALVHQWAGLTGVVLLFSLVLALTYACLFPLLAGRGANILLAAAVALVTIVASSQHWLARPHLFSYLLTVVWYGILLDFAEQRRNRLLLLPLLTILWVNLHGGFAVGFLLLGLFLVDSLWRALTLPAERAQALAAARQLTVTLTAVLAASAINPFGWHILWFPFRVVGDAFLMDHVAEFLAPNFHEAVTFKYFLLLLVALFALGRQRLHVREVLITLCFLDMALVSSRHIPLFVILMSPVVLRLAQEMIAGSEATVPRIVRGLGARIATLDREANNALWPMAGIIAVIVCAASGQLNRTFDPNLKAVDAVRFLAAEPIPGHVFNTDEIGDYMIYAAWPRYRVFFDGRSDMYGAGRLKEYIRISRLESGWQELLDRYDIGWLFVQPDCVLARHLMESPGDWHLVYADRVARIFVRDRPEYQDIIGRHPKVTPPPLSED